MKGRITINDLFPRRFVRGQDLNGPLLVRITKIDTAVVHPRPGMSERVYVLWFDNLDPRTWQTVKLPGFLCGPYGHAVIMRRKLAEQIVAALGTDVVSDWPGRVVVLEPKRVSGKQTLTARASKQIPLRHSSTGQR